MASTNGSAYPVEPKVKAAGIATYIAGLLLVALVTGLQDGQLLEELPDWGTALLAPILPTIAAWVAGYAARHQYRATEGRTAPTP